MSALFAVVVMVCIFHGQFFLISFQLILCQATKEWFRIYKMPAGKPPNNFAFDGAAKDKVS